MSGVICCGVSVIGSNMVAFKCDFREGLGDDDDITCSSRRGGRLVSI